MDSFPVSRAANSQPAGIGRIASLGSGCAWNNLGRNVVFADASLRPLAVFGDTVFPEDDEASQFDLDIHAILELGDTGEIAVVNHLGLVRIFSLPRFHRPELDVAPYVDETRRLDCIADVERVTVLGDRLVTSRPRGERLGGVLITRPIGSSRECLEVTTAQESFGFVTALATRTTPEGTGWVALGGEGRVRLVEADRGRLGATRWEVGVDFLSAVLLGSGSSLWAAGSALGGAGLDDYDWEQLEGGGLAQLDLASGAVVSIRTVRCRPRLGKRRRAPGPRGRRALWRGPPGGVARAGSRCTDHHPGHQRAGPTPARDRSRGGGGRPTGLRLQSRRVRAPHVVVAHRQRTGQERSGP